MLALYHKTKFCLFQLLLLFFLNVGVVYGDTIDIMKFIDNALLSDKEIYNMYKLSQDRDNYNLQSSYLFVFLPQIVFNVDTQVDSNNINLLLSFRELGYAIRDMIKHTSTVDRVEQVEDTEEGWFVWFSQIKDSIISYLETIMKEKAKKAGKFLFEYLFPDKDDSFRKLIAFANQLAFSTRPLQVDVTLSLDYNLIGDHSVSDVIDAYQFFNSSYFTIQKAKEGKIEEYAKLYVELVYDEMLCSRIEEQLEVAHSFLLNIEEDSRLQKTTLQLKKFILQKEIDVRDCNLQILSHKNLWSQFIRGIAPRPSLGSLKDIIQGVLSVTDVNKYISSVLSKNTELQHLNFVIFSEDLRRKSTFIEDFFSVTVSSVFGVSRDLYLPEIQDDYWKVSVIGRVDLSSIPQWYGRYMFVLPGRVFHHNLAYDLKQQTIVKQLKKYFFELNRLRYKRNMVQKSIDIYEKIKSKMYVSDLSKHEIIYIFYKRSKLQVDILGLDKKIADIAIKILIISGFFT